MLDASPCRYLLEEVEDVFAATTAPLAQKRKLTTDTAPATNNADADQTVPMTDKPKAKVQKLAANKKQISPGVIAVIGR